MMPYPRSQNKIHNLILETLEKETEIGNLLLQVDSNKEKIQKYFDEKGIKKEEIDVTSNLRVICKKTERATIKYDVEKLKQKLDDEMFIEVTNRSYTISDINAMIKLVKDAGIKAKDFKKLIIPKVTVDGQAVKRLYDAGEIDMKTLNGTFTATISKSIKITTEEEGGKN